MKDVDSRLLRAECYRFSGTGVIYFCPLHD